MQVREKVAKSRNTMFFQWFVAPEGRKVGSLKWRMRSLRDEKLHAVVARSTFPSQNVQNTPCSKNFWKLRCRKSAHRSGAKHISKSKCSKHQAQGIVHTLSHVSKMWRFSSISKNDGRRGTFEESLERCIFRGRRSTRDMFIRDVRRSGQGADFLRGVAFWSIRSSVLGRWYCVTGAALCMTWYHFFVAGAILQRHGLEKSQNALVRGRQLCTQLSSIEGSLAELLRFWCCQLQTLRRSRRIVSFLMLPTSKIEEVSQNSFVFKLAERQIDR